MNQGEIIKRAIKKAGLTMDQAAVKLKMSRQALYNNIIKADPDEKFVQNVEKVLGIKLGTVASNNEDLITRLQEENERLKKELSETKTELIEVLKSLVRPKK